MADGRRIHGVFGPRELVSFNGALAETWLQQMRLPESGSCTADSDDKERVSRKGAVPAEFVV
jgi:hypothetical protein